MTTHTPTAEELQALTEEANAWMEATGRKRFPRAKQDELLEMGAKRCGCCTEVRRITEFNKDASRPDGLRAKCQPCQSGSNAKWREVNPEAHRAYRAEHLEERRAYDRTRYATNELYRLRDQLKKGYHRAVKAGNEAERITAEELVSYWESVGINPLVCIYTGAQLTPQDRSLDHATPIAKGGSHTVSNLVPASFDANYAKGNRTVEEFWATLSEKEQE